MALDEERFDQDNDGGWRKLASTRGCETVAADAIRDYRATRHTESRILYWHEGQLRAVAGDYANAIPLLEKSRKPIAEDVAGWNPYVDATVAFLQKDRAALERARMALLAVKPSDVFNVKDGFVEIHMGNGKTDKFRWPMNIDVVDGLGNCFDKSYVDAYGQACRHQKN